LLVWVLFLRAGKQPGKTKGSWGPQFVENQGSCGGEHLGGVRERALKGKFFKSKKMPSSQGWAVIEEKL